MLPSFARPPDEGVRADVGIAGHVASRAAMLLEALWRGSLLSPFFRIVIGHDLYGVAAHCESEFLIGF